MIVAGSVLTLLLMGLAVDGFVNPAAEEDEDPASSAGGTKDLSDEQGDNNGLDDLLYADDESSDHALQDVPPEDAEDFSDLTWKNAAAAEQTSVFVEIDTVTAVESGEDVAYVENFNPETDTLVLEFDGMEADAPEITVEYDPKEDAAIVFANGLPVTWVEGAQGMTPDHVSVVMDGVDPEFGPQVIPDADHTDALALDDDLPAPQTQVLPAEAEAAVDLPQTSPTEVTSSALPDPDTEGPQILPQSQQETTDPAPLTQITNLTPLLPDSATLDVIFDQATGDLASVGGVAEMLTARAGIDDAFGTGGEDAMTGSLNDEMIVGGNGQDALFGNEGDDTLMAGMGNDELYGDSGNDDLQGEAGVDFLDGGEGQDTLDGGGDRDLLFGGDGDDVLYGGAANDFLQGGLGADMLNGGSGDDVLDGVYGEDGIDRDDADILWGGSGNDHLIIGQGDTAHGGEGADTFTAGTYIENASVAGHVADFNPSEDRIEIIFDPQHSPSPTLEVLDFADGSGADIILNGEVILSVAGAQGLDPNMIDLRAMA